MKIPRGTSPDSPTGGALDEGYVSWQLHKLEHRIETRGLVPKRKRGKNTPTHSSLEYVVAP